MLHMSNVAATPEMRGTIFLRRNEGINLEGAMITCYTLNPVESGFDSSVTAGKTYSKRFVE